MVECEYCRRRNKDEYEVCSGCGAPLPMVPPPQEFVRSYVHKVLPYSGTSDVINPILSEWLSINEQ